MIWLTNWPRYYFGQIDTSSSVRVAVKCLVKCAWDLWCGWCANSAGGISAAPDAEFIFRICLSFQHYSTLRFCGVVSGGRPDWRMSWLTDWHADGYLIISVAVGHKHKHESVPIGAIDIPMMWRTEDDMSSSYRVMMRCESPQPGHSTIISYIVWVCLPSLFYSQPNKNKHPSLDSVVRRKPSGLTNLLFGPVSRHHRCWRLVGIYVGRRSHSSGGGASDRQLLKVKYRVWRRRRMGKLKIPVRGELWPPLVTADAKAVHPIKGYATTYQFIPCSSSSCGIVQATYLVLTMWNK